MHKTIYKIVLLSGLLLCSTGILYSQQLAFPTAEGWGKYTVGGRGGAVYEVTNLNDAGSGSLRAAVNASGPRTVVFSVSGTIDLQSNLDINNPYITIAGQTAPGDGICIKRYPIMIRTNEVIIRYIRVRLGNESGEDTDAISSRYNENIIIDHVSASWSIDECVSIYHNDKVTVQWCLISESLYDADHVKGHHGFGGIWGGPNSSYHHNLIAHHSSRNPRFASGCGKTDFRNNVIYNWGYQSAYGAEKAQENSTTFIFSAVNMAANYYKPGPGTLGGNNEYKIVQPSSRNYLADYGEWFVADNYIYGYPNITTDNWSGGVQPDDNTQTVRDSIRLDTPAEFIPIDQQTAEVAYQLVLEYVGASLPHRDTIDKRIKLEVINGSATYGTGSYNVDHTLGATPSGIIDKQEDVGGWPVLNTGTVPADTDHDGMPDDWETANGLLKDDPTDRNGIGDGGYTNLEIYLNSITGYPAFLLYPTEVAAKLTSITSVELTWKDIVEGETGFRIERAEGDTGNFADVAELGADVTIFEDSGLKELTLYRYRVIAFNDSLTSASEGEVSLTTLGPSSLPTAISYLSPTKNALNIGSDTTLMWTASLNADSYDVYFGPENPPPFVANQVDLTFETGEMEMGTKYYWRINARNSNGTTEGLVWRFTTEYPEGLMLNQDKLVLASNYPNPFTLSTTIEYELKTQNEVMLTVYTIMGGEIANLVNEKQTAGKYFVRFDASDMDNGIYIYRLKVGSFEVRGKMLLMK